MSSELPLGLSCCVISGLMFGTMFVPFRYCGHTRDGFFVQWVMAAAIFVFGLCLNFILENPPFQTYGVISGLIFASGNICALPIVNNLGIGLAILITGTAQIVVGWATSRFGTFGLFKPEPPNYDWLNYVGVVITVASGFMFGYVHLRHHSEDKDHSKVKDSFSDVSVIPWSDAKMNGDAVLPSDKHNLDMAEHKSSFFTEQRMKWFFMCLCVYVGCAYGSMFVPIVYAMEKIEGSPTNMLHYAFSFFSGAFGGASFYFLLYTLIMKNRPYIDQTTVIPALISGCLWSAGMTAWLVSGSRLSQAISFPITTRLPGVTAALLDLLVFREFKTRTNQLLMFVAIIIALIGVTLVGLSKADL